MVILKLIDQINDKYAAYVHKHDCGEKIKGSAVYTIQHAVVFLRGLRRKEKKKG